MSRSSPNAAIASRRAAASASGSRPRLADRAHPLAAAAGRRLDDEREADLAGRPGQDAVALSGAVVAGRGPGCRARPPADGRPPCRPSRGSPTGEARPSGSRPPRPARRTSAFSARNPKPGWSGVGTGGQRCRHDGRGIEQVEAVRAVRDRDDRPDPEPIAGAGDPSGDLAAVGDEDRSDRCRELGRLGGSSTRAGRTRQVRHMRHASGHRRDARVAVRSRSSAERIEVRFRGAQRPLVDSTRLASWRECRTCPDQAPTISGVIRRRCRP